MRRIDMMTKDFLFAIFLLLTVTVWADTYSALSLNIKLKKDTYKVGEPVEGKIEVRNTAGSFPAIFDIQLYHGKELFTEFKTSFKSVPAGTSTFSFKDFGIPAFNNSPVSEGEWTISIIQQDTDASNARWATVTITAERKHIRYVALGDSYTIGTGALPSQSWPAVVTDRLQDEDIDIELVENLGHNGWTTEDLIENELPALEDLKPDLVTLLIGANDWGRGVDAQTFGRRFHTILEHLMAIVHDPKRILVITIPDFSKTSTGKEYLQGMFLTKNRSLKEFNRLIIKEAKAFGVAVVDLYPLSQEQAKDGSLTSPDGLHPSARGYAQWATLIKPAIKAAIQ